MVAEGPKGKLKLRHPTNLGKSRPPAWSEPAWSRQSVERVGKALQAHPPKFARRRNPFHRHADQGLKKHIS
jgi:hypothetical protein